MANLRQFMFSKERGIGDFNISIACFLQENGWFTLLFIR